MLIKDYREATLAHAREFAGEEIYKFSDLEEKALNSFFTNARRRVFFMHTLPTNIGNTLLAMYSRIKNPRIHREQSVSHIGRQSVHKKHPPPGVSEKTA